MGVGGTRFTNKLGDSYFLKEISDAFDVCILYIRPPTTMFSFCPPSHRVPRFFFGFNIYVIICFWPGQIKSREADHRVANRRIRDRGQTKNDA